ncbi:hypothetical protein [Bacillus licheniformis]|uniref:hypothetical protein n=1 Tax=Bacillus licheniformis TaxID=1402 RepID=UPI001C3FDC70|nr:hypothetical protein [Bacillus licheniformis]
MKYYEIHEPYYALIAAVDEKKAAEVYCEVVTDDVDETLKDNIKEVSRQYALGCVGMGALQNNPTLSISEFVRDFNELKNDWLIIDRALE